MLAILAISAKASGPMPDGINMHPTIGVDAGDAGDARGAMANLSLQGAEMLC
jgi:hypothetical protein